MDRALRSLLRRGPMTRVEQVQDLLLYLGEAERACHAARALSCPQEQLERTVRACRALLCSSTRNGPVIDDARRRALANWSTMVGNGPPDETPLLVAVATPQERVPLHVTLLLERLAIARKPDGSLLAEIPRWLAQTLACMAGDASDEVEDLRGTLSEEEILEMSLVLWEPAESQVFGSLRAAVEAAVRLADDRMPLTGGSSL